MNIKTIFGENLKYYRKQNNLTQEELSEALEITPKHLGAIERGMAFISAELLEKIIKYLNVSASALFLTGEEAPAKKKQKTNTGEFFTKLDAIVEAELKKTARTIKRQIRRR
jgi:transcriptional regulator with XRE-family HTH domain